MPRRPTRTVPTVLLPGPLRNRDDDWQAWLAGQLRAAGREVRVAEWANPQAPDLTEWSGVLRETLDGLPDDGFDVLAQSLSCLLWLHHATTGTATTGTATTSGTVDGPASKAPRPARVALVAPPALSPPAELAAAWASFYPVPLDIDAIRGAADGTVLVGGDDDPYCPGGVALAYGGPLKMAATVISGAGALTADTGYGSWPAVLDWCGRDNLAFIA